jgi:hypothetical protein
MEIVPDQNLDPPDADFTCDECGDECEDDGHETTRGFWLCPDCWAELGEDDDANDN